MRGWNGAARRRLPCIRARLNYTKVSGCIRRNRPRVVATESTLGRDGIAMWSAFASLSPKAVPEANSLGNKPLFNPHRGGTLCSWFGCRSESADVVSNA